MSRVLVTGGAGYVGSHVVRRLRDAGREVVVLDDLSTGHRDACRGVRLVEGDIGDGALVERICRDGAPVTAVVHLAARCLVGESMRDPVGYYEVNVRRSLALLAAVARCSVGSLVFSSSAAVYGEPETLPIDEAHATRPLNPYGETKLAFERALHWAERDDGPRWCALRYFNAAGAHTDGTLGEDHTHETHLVPRLLRSSLGLDEAPVELHGDDWPTADGSCVRDYVHVEDLAEAHAVALERLVDGGPTLGAINLGTGQGTSVRTMIDAVTRVCGRAPSVRTSPRRPGDPASLVASGARAADVLGWSPRHELESIVASAAAWHRSHPHGYAG